MNFNVISHSGELSALRCSFVTRPGTSLVKLASSQMKILTITSIVSDDNSNKLCNLNISTGDSTYQACLGCTELELLEIVKVELQLQVGRVVSRTSLETRKFVL